MYKSFVLCLALAVAAQASWSGTYHVMRRMPTIKRVAQVNNGRIIGGQEAAIGQFPYQVGLFIDGSGFCGGSLISDSVVMTAAHCAQGSSFHDVKAGAHMIEDDNEPGRVNVRSNRHTVHENYNPITVNNDIALVFLPNSISGPNIGSVRLPSRGMAGDTFAGVDARSSGWGRVSDANPNISPVLKYVDVVIVDNQVCRDKYGFIITACHVCIDTAGGTAGVCNGDSGGPLTIDEGDGIRTQVGVTSFVSSSGCEASGTPHGYCRVTCYLDWLETNAGVTIRP